MTKSAEQLIVRPSRPMLATTVLSIVVAMIPIFGVLYWFAAAHGEWPAVLTMNIVVAVACLGILARRLTVFSAIDAHQIYGRGIFSPMVRVQLDKIARVDLVSTLVGQSPEPVRQLLIRDQAGKRLYRMRGNFWLAADLDALTAALPVDANVVTNPVPLGEFFESYPGSAYWFEARPVLVGFILTASVIAAIAILIVALRVLGMPIAFLPG